jgi:hypothetical protein
MCLRKEVGKSIPYIEKTVETINTVNDIPFKHSDPNKPMYMRGNARNY